MATNQSFFGSMIRRTMLKIQSNRRSLECIAVSLGVHVVLLLLISLLVLPAQGTPSAIFAEVSLESSWNTSESVQPNPNEVYSVPQEHEEYISQESLSKSIQEIQEAMDIPNSQEVKQYIAKREENVAQKKRLLDDMKKQQGNIAKAMQIRGQYGTLAPRSFYGVKLSARSMIFMLDVSGSMSIEDGQRQLKNAYQSLQPSEYFNIIAYAESAQIWQKDLVSATPENIQSANQWVNALKNGGATDLYSALESAFNRLSWNQIRPEVVYFISDGLPTFGPVQHDLIILDAVRKWNKDKNIALYVIGLGHHQNRYLLKKLAQENYGQYFER